MWPVTRGPEDASLQQTSQMAPKTLTELCHIQATCNIDLNPAAFLRIKDGRIK